MRLAFLFLSIGIAAGQYNEFPYTAGGLFSNFTSPTTPTASKPAKNGCVVNAFWDATNGVCLVGSVVDDARPTTPTATELRPPYSRWAVSNADGSKWYATRNAEQPSGSGKGQSIIFNSSDNSIAKTTTEFISLEAATLRWDAVDPQTLYYVSFGVCRMYSYNVVSGVSTLVHDFKVEYPDCTRLGNGVEGDSSADSRYWVWWVINRTQFGVNYTSHYVVYDKQTDTIIGDMDRAAYLALGGNATAWDFGQAPNMVDMSPKGDWVMFLWPGMKYGSQQAGPIPVNMTIASGTVVVSGSGTVLTIASRPVWPTYVTVGDKVRISCNGMPTLTGNYTVTGLTGTNTIVIDITGGGATDGSKSCTGSSPNATINPAVTQVQVTSNVATVTYGMAHALKTGMTVTMAVPGAPAALTGNKVITSVPTPYTLTFAAVTANVTYTVDQMKGTTTLDGVFMSDTETRYPAWRAATGDTVHWDGSHIYPKDFSSYRRVSNSQSHTGWAFALDGEEMFCSQINGSSWSLAEVDTFGCAHTASLGYIPIFRYSDVGYGSGVGGVHFGRFYDFSIRGWVLMSTTLEPSQTSNLVMAGQWVALEIKPYTQHPRIWRLTHMYTRHYNYPSEGHGPVSRDGLTLRWGGNWLTNSVTDTLQYQIPLRIKTIGSLTATPSPTEVQLGYVSAYPSTACTWSVYSNAGMTTLVSSGTDSAPANQLVTVNVTGLNPVTQYWPRVTCPYQTTSGAGGTDTLTLDGTGASFTTLSGGSSPIVIDPSTPDGTVGQAYSITGTASGGTLPYTWSLASGSLAGCPGLALSQVGNDGVVSGTLSGAGSCSFVLRVTDSAMQSDNGGSLSITVNAAPTISGPASLPDDLLGNAYDQTLTVTGGTGALSCSLDSGTPPTGVSITSGCHVSGVLTAAGTFNFTAAVTDANHIQGTHAYTIVVNTPTPISSEVLGSSTLTGSSSVK